MIKLLLVSLILVPGLSHVLGKEPDRDQMNESQVNIDYLETTPEI